MKHTPYNYFIWPLVIGNLLLIGCYFSGNYVLQQIVAPAITGFDQQSREFGLLEMLQNLFLLAIVVLFLKAAFQSQPTQPRPTLDRIVFTLGALVFIVLFLEEIDYGLHFRTLLSDGAVQVEFRNVHNQWTEDGIEYATYMKKLNDGITILWFALIPLCLYLSPYAKQAREISLLPSKWFFFGFIIAVLFSEFAHYLDDNGYGAINGKQGMLYESIAEFRETSNYYLYLLYAWQLFNGSPLFTFNKPVTADDEKLL